MPDPMMAMMFAMRSAVPLTTLQSLKERAPSALQKALVVGDCGFQMRDGGFYSDQLTVVEILDPTNAVPDWEERVDRGYFYCRWHSVENPEGDYGWFARIFTLPLSREIYEELCVDFVENPNQDHYRTEHYEEMDRVYRDWSAEMSEDSDEMTAVRCEKCFSHQIQIHVDHLSHIDGSAMWRTESDGSVKLVPTSKLVNCEVKSQLVCVDCGWSRAVEEGELANLHN